MTDGTTQVDKMVARVEALKEPLTSITYNADRLRRVVAESHGCIQCERHRVRNNPYILLMTRSGARSAEGAFELVESFQNVQSRDVRSRRPTSVPSAVSAPG